MPVPFRHVEGFYAHHDQHYNDFDPEKRLKNVELFESCLLKRVIQKGDWLLSNYSATHKNRPIVLPFRNHPTKSPRCMNASIFPPYPEYLFD